MDKNNDSKYQVSGSQHDQPAEDSMQLDPSWSNLQPSHTNGSEGSMEHESSWDPTESDAEDDVNFGLDSVTANAPVTATDQPLPSLEPWGRRARQRQMQTSHDGYEDDDKEEVDNYQGSGRRLGSFNPNNIAQPITSPTISNSEAQAHAAMLREARERRQLAAEAAARRVSRPLGQTSSPSASNCITSSSQASSSVAFMKAASQTDGQTISSMSPPTDASTPAPSNPVRAMMAERAARIAEQQRLLDIANRVKEKQRLQEKETKRNASLTPQELAEKKVKEQALEKVKKEKAAAIAERERVKRNIEADRKFKQEKREAELERKAVIRAEQERKEAAKKALELQVMKDLEAEEAMRTDG